MMALSLRMISLVAAMTLSAVAAGAPARSEAETDRFKIVGAQKQEVERAEKEAIQYFLDNQTESGLILDRQRNFGKLIPDGMCSISATGMGLIAIAVASDDHHKLISREDAIERIKKALNAALKLKSEHGMMPHFLNAKSLEPIGNDAVATIDSTWLLAGGLWAGQYLNDNGVKQLADKLYNRVDWTFWSKKIDAGTRLSHGMDPDGKFLKGIWDRLNGETAFMYALGIGATKNALPAELWNSFDPAVFNVAGENLPSGDLGLFVFQYSDDLMNLKDYGGKPQLASLPLKAVLANYQVCKQANSKFKTYKEFWGLSAGDGPPNKAGEQDAYRAYAPDHEMDGTAHITATLASIEVRPDLVLQNVDAAEALKEPKIHGRYGYSNVNLDKNWVSNDVVGIDMGAAVMGMEDELYDDVIKRTWAKIPAAARAQTRINALVAH